LKIFLESQSEETQLHRKSNFNIIDNLVERDIKERGRVIEDVIYKYNYFSKPAYEKFILPVRINFNYKTRENADIILPCDNIKVDEIFHGIFKLLDKSIVPNL